MKKQFSKLISILLICTIMITFFPINTIAGSKPKLNKSKVTINVGKTTTLKVKNSKSTWKWKTSNKKIATVKKGKVKALKVGKCTITASLGKKKLTCKVTVKKSEQKQTESEMIFEISQWLCDAMWNNGLCNLRYYYSTGLDACGEKMDVNKTVSNFNEAYKKADEYNKKINGLTNKKYNKMKKLWAKTYTELVKLHTQVNEIDWSKCPTDDGRFNTDTFQEYFLDLYYEMLDCKYL